MSNARKATTQATPLVPCPTCQRHVFASGASKCPFCRTALPHDLALRAAPTTARRLSRSETFGFNARKALDPSQLTAASGGLRVMPDAEGIDFGTALESDGGGIHPMYGAPVDPYDPGNVHPVYGAPAEPYDPGGVQPIYGA
jgi:hypothetical protein